MKEVKIDNLTFKIYEDGSAYVTKCEKDATDVVIPALVEDAYVKGIEALAFENCNALRSVKLPEFDEELYYDDKRFEEIGDNAFMGCTSLEEIFIPFTVFSVNRGAFYGCTSLRKVEIENQLSTPYFYPYAFIDCSSLTDITPLNSLGDGMFSGCSSLKYLPITERCTDIGEDCFERCDALTDITIPKGIKSIEGLAFRGCANLKRVTFEEPEGWFVKIAYAVTPNERHLDLSDPERNAKRLSGMDFDDGIVGWYRK